MVFANKPDMTRKFSRFYNTHKTLSEEKKFQPWGFVLNYSNKCNFKCEHCFTNSRSGDINNETLSLGEIRSLADQADELGVFEFDLQGGEPLMYENLFEIFETVDTKRFYTVITTNGWFLTEELAAKLAAAGVDKIICSLDSFVPEEHDKFRGKQGSYAQVMRALEYTKKAGMKPSVVVTVGCFNAKSEELGSFIKWAKDKEYSFLINAATPTGAWQGKYETMLQPDDSLYLEQYRNDNPNMVRDLWNIIGKKELVVGCPAVNYFYVNPTGDILPCVFIHTKLGNIREQKLKDILEYGFQFEYFCKLSKKCLAGENIEFAKRYLGQETSVINPKPVAEFFAFNS